MANVIVSLSMILGRVDISLFTSQLIRTAVQMVQLNPVLRERLLEFLSSLDAVQSDFQLCRTVTIFNRDGFVRMLQRMRRSQRRLSEFHSFDCVCRGSASVWLRQSPIQPQICRFHCLYHSEK
jgi:hypothetical protein